MRLKQIQCDHQLGSYFYAEQQWQSALRGDYGEMQANNKKLQSAHYPFSCFASSCHAAGSCAFSGQEVHYSGALAKKYESLMHLQTMAMDGRNVGAVTAW